MDGGQDYLHQSEWSTNPSIYVICMLFRSPQLRDRWLDFDRDRLLTTCSVPGAGLIFYKGEIILSFQEPNELGSFLYRWGRLIESLESWIICLNIVSKIIWTKIWFPPKYMPLCCTASESSLTASLWARNGWDWVKPRREAWFFFSCVN